MDEEQWYVDSKKEKRSYYKKNKSQPKYTFCSNDHLPQGRIVRIDRNKIYLYYQKEILQCTLKKRMFLEKK